MGGWVGGTYLASSSSFVLDLAGQPHIGVVGPPQAHEDGDGAQHCTPEEGDEDTEEAHSSSLFLFLFPSPLGF